MFKKVIVWLLTVAMIISFVPSNAFAKGSDDYSISNGYMVYTFNAKTGGFSIDTDEGHPQKVLDNKIPLLYKEDEERSNGTSFVTVRIDGKDYVFGQDYGFFGMNSELKTPVVSSEGRLITIEWTINKITVVKRVALGTDINSDVTGNAGISFEVKNNSGKAANVGIRLLLDTALGNSIDAPYVVVGEDLSPTYVETEFKDDDVPSQIRNVDSLSKPNAVSYIIAKGWEGGTAPNRLIVGHWANIANTRYEYTADKYCDFTNYSNQFREPDAAVAVYWDNQSIEDNGSFKAETLYGIGNFSSDTQNGIGININAERVKLSTDKTEYVNDGEITVTVEIDNTLDDSTKLTSVVLNVGVNDDDFETIGEQRAEYSEIGEAIKTNVFKLRAKPQTEITAGEIYVSLTATKLLSDGSQQTVEEMSERSVILPAIKGKTADIQMREVNPKIVWTGAEKAITVTGNMSEFDALSANQGWSLYLKHTETDHKVLIEKKNVSFLDEEYKNMSFTTDEELIVGKYEIVFEFTDADLQESFGKLIKAAATVEVSANQKYRLKSYGIVSLVRSTINNVTDYDFYTFANEGEYLEFYDGELTKIGALRGKKVKHDFGKDVDATQKHEILLTVRGNLREMEKQDGDIKKKYWQAEFKDGDIIINNILSYEGDNPLEMYEDNGKFVIAGDGLLKVVNSVNVWKAEWSFNVWDGIIYTLDESRLNSAHIGSKKITLSLDGAAVMLQSAGGFLIDMKYGEMSSSWYDDADGRVTYGVGFGGQIALPIDTSKSTVSPTGTTPSTPSTPTTPPSTPTSPTTTAPTTDRILTSDQEDISDSMRGLFGDDDDDSTTPGATTPGTTTPGTTTPGTTTPGTTTPGTTTPGTTTPGTTAPGTTTPGTTTTSGAYTSSQLKNKPTGLTGAQLSAAVRNVMFGENGEVKNKKVVVEDIGFIGIDTTLQFGLPEDILGSLVQNAPGLMVSMTINTIDNIYELNVGVSIKILECEGLLAFKEVRIKNKDTIVPDKIEFHVRQGLAIPVGPPGTPVFITGLGGGVHGLADTIGGNFTTLPPITLLLSMRLEVIKLLQGNFNARVNLEGLSLDGHLTINNLEELLSIEAGLSARWVEPWSINLYGQANIIDGLIKGGITVTIADNYFYGYIYANICIPESIPLIGGTEMGGVEAAVSNEFVGANIKILGFKYGVIYYWGGGVSFDKNIDLSAPAGRASLMSINDGFEVVDGDSGVTGYYGTNVHPLIAEPVVSDSSSSVHLMNTDYMELSASIQNAENQGALLFEIPYMGSGTPTSDEIILVNPDGIDIEMIDADGNGGGNFLVQNRRENGKSIYISVTDSNLVKSGEWTFKYKTENITVSNMKANGVSDIAELNECSISYSEQNPFRLDVSWSTSSESTEKGTVDIYLTKDKDILSKIKTGNNHGNVLGDNILHLDNQQVKSGSSSLTLPETYESGTYYAVVMMSAKDGISLEISPTAFTFTNPDLPKAVESVKAIYGGNGNLHVKIEDSDNPDYTHYLVEIKAEDGTVLSNNVNQYAKGDSLIFIGNNAKLTAGKSYYVNVKTLREEKEVPTVGTSEAETTKYYYSAETKKSSPVTIPQMNKPKLLSVEANFDTSSEFINTDRIKLEYKFEQPVFMELSLIGQKVYSDDEFKTDWSFDIENLEDGDYVIDYTAYSLSKDYSTGADFAESIPNAQLGFTIDTSSPTLSLAQAQDKSLENTVAIFGTNTVFAEESGSYTVCGLTEESANLTVDGSADGITRGEGGSFSFTKALAEGESSVEHTIKAVDKAGNSSELIVSAVDADSYDLDSIILLADNAPIVSNSLAVVAGESVALTAMGITADGKQIKLSNDSLEWNVPYEKNKVLLSNGTVTALSPGETAVGVKLKTSAVETMGGEKQNSGLWDYTVLLVEENTRADLKTAIDESTELFNSSIKASQSAKEALKAAISAAQAVYDDSSADGDKITTALNTLKKSVEVFKKSLSGGSASVGGIGAIYYNVTAVSEGKGTVSLSNDRAKSGTSVTVTALPDEGYSVTDILVNGISVGNESPYTIKSVTKNTEIKVVFGIETWENPFTDVKSTDWFYNSVKTAFEKKLMLGVSETSFNPSANITRGMFVTVLYRMDGEPEAGNHEFDDVSEENYFAKAVAWASENKIVYGISDSKFAPQSNISREQMAAIVYRYAEFKGYGTVVSDSSDYTDNQKISDYAMSAVSWAANNKIMLGNPDGTFAPQNNSTRAQAAAVFCRMLEIQK